MPAPKRRRLLLAAALGLIVVPAVTLSGRLSPRPAPRYTVTDLGVLPGYGESGASAINSRGEVAVTINGPGGRQACVYQRGRITGLGVVPGGSSAEGINAAGDVVGLTGLPGARRAFLYRGNKMRVLGMLPGFTGCGGAAINDRGEVAGTVATSPSPAGLPHEHAFIYAAARMTDIGTPPGCSESEAVGINAAGLVTGEGLPAPGEIDKSRPFLYDSRTGAMTLLPMPPLTRGGWAPRTNGSGQTVGTIWTANDRYHVVLWAGGRMKDLGTAPGSTDSAATGLNNRGEAVGYSFEHGSTEAVKAFLRDHAGGDTPLRHFLSLSSNHAFVYQGGRMQDLGELIPRDADWTLEYARAINDRGQIVGYGLHYGRKRGFLLTPR